MRNAVILALATSVFLSAAGYGQDAVVIRLKKDAVGDKTKQSIVEDAVTTTTFVANGRLQTKTERMTTRYTYVEDVLAKAAGAKKPTKLSRAYELAETTTDGVKKTYAFQGKTVLIEKKGNKFEVTANGLPLAEDDAKTFASEFGKGNGPEDEDLLPAKPVAIGGTWSPNLEKILPLMSKDLPFGLAKTGNAATGKLIKAYRNNGVPFGEFELTFSLKPSTFKSGENVIPLKPGCTLELTMKLDACIDGSAHTGTMTNTMAANIEFDRPDKAVKIQSQVKQVQTVTPVKQ
ncbi:MAG TPA: hypothetical protein VGJ05_18165 [Fimbriiglobus sp.]|jgi:hypothetical protein